MKSTTTITTDNGKRVLTVDLRGHIEWQYATSPKDLDTKSLANHKGFVLIITSDETTTDER